MSEEPANSQPKQANGRFLKGQSGNPAGRKPGTRTRATMAAEALLDGETEALTRKAVELALAGNAQALRLCLERILPPRRDRPTSFAIPRLQTAADAVAAMGAIVEGVASGNLTAGEAADISRLVDVFASALHTRELEVRLASLEDRLAQRGLDAHQ